MRTLTITLIEFLFMLAIGFALIVLISACGDPSDLAPADPCGESAFEFCDRAIECGQINETARDDCEAFSLAYCTSPPASEYWYICEDALDALECPVYSADIEAECWHNHRGEP